MCAPRGGRDVWSDRVTARPSFAKRPRGVLEVGKRTRSALPKVCLPCCLKSSIRSSLRSQTAVSSGSRITLDRASLQSQRVSPIRWWVKNIFPGFTEGASSQKSVNKVIRSARGRFGQIFAALVWSGARRAQRCPPPERAAHRFAAGSRHFAP